MSREETKNPVLMQALRVALETLILLGVMVGIFALLGRFSLKVLYSGALGWLVTNLNFFAMCLSVLIHTSDSTAGAAQAAAKVRISYTLRTVVIFVALFLLLKTGWFQPVALLVPLVFVRPCLMVDQLLFRKERKKAFKETVEGTAQEETGKGEKEALEAEEQEQEEGEKKES